MLLENKKSKRMNAREKVLTSLKNDIEMGAMTSGQILMVDELIRKFGVSRTPVREALLSLVDLGFLKARSRLGFEVTSIDTDELLDVYNMRILLETKVIELASQRITKDEIKELRNLLVASSDRNAAKCNREFHTAIAQASGSKILSEMVETVLWRGYRGASLDSFIKNPQDIGFKSHLEIVRALELGDADLASSVMCLHISHARYRIKQSIKRSLNTPINFLDEGETKNEIHEFFPE